MFCLFEGFTYLGPNRLLTSLKADLCEEINGGFAFCRCLCISVNEAGALMEHFLEGSAPLRLLVSYLRREDLYLLLFAFGLMYQCHNGAIPTRKYSIMVPAK